MAETRSPKSKGKKLDSIISKLKINPNQDTIDTQKPDTASPQTTENVENVDVSRNRKSKRKSQKILRYRIDDSDNEGPTTDTEEAAQQDGNNEADVQLPKTIFEEIPNGETATFEQGEDTTVLFLPAEGIQVEAVTSGDYLMNLLDGEASYHEDENEEEKQSEKTKKKKKKKKHQESEDSLDEDGLPRRVICTACGRKVNPSHGTILRHPILNVLVCKKCNRYYNSGPFTRDEFGIEEQCRWCGDGGDLICCDMCEKVFCKPCIQRNCGKTYLKNLLNAPDDFKWLCIVCNKEKPSKHIQRLRKKCNDVMEALAHVKEQKAHFKSKKGKEPSVVSGPTTSERRRELNCLSAGIKSEGFSSSGESPTKKSQELPAELFSKTEDEGDGEEGNENEEKSENEGKEDGVEELKEDNESGNDEQSKTSTEKQTSLLNEADEDKEQNVENITKDKEENREVSETLKTQESPRKKSKLNSDLEITSYDKPISDNEEEEIETVRVTHSGKTTDKKKTANDANETESKEEYSEEEVGGEEVTQTDSSQKTTDKKKTANEVNDTDSEEEDKGEGESTEEIRVTRSGKVLGKEPFKRTKTPQGSDKDEDKEPESKDRKTLSGKVTDKSKAKEIAHKNGKDQTSSQEAQQDEDGETDKEEDIEEVRATRSGKVLGKEPTKAAAQKNDKDRVKDTDFDEKSSENEQEENEIKEVEGDNQFGEDEQASKDRRLSLRNKRTNSNNDVQSKVSCEKKNPEKEQEKEVEEEKCLKTSKQGRARKKSQDNQDSESKSHSVDENEKATAKKYKSKKNHVNTGSEDTSNDEEIRLTRSGKTAGKRKTKETRQRHSKGQAKASESTQDTEEEEQEEEQEEEVRVTRSGKAIRMNKTQGETPQHSDNSSTKNSDGGKIKTVINKLKQETDEQDSSENGKILKTRRKSKTIEKHTKKSKHAAPQVIVLDSSDSNGCESVREGNQTKAKKRITKVKEEAKDSTSSDTSDVGSKTTKGKKKSRSTKGTGQGRERRKNNIKEESDSLESSDTATKSKDKETTKTRKSLRQMSSDSDFQAKKTSRKKTGINKRKQRIDSSESEEHLSSLSRRKANVKSNSVREESSDSDENLSSMLKRRGMKNKEYSLEESSESDEKSSDTDEESEEESDNKNKKTKRGRGLQKQTRKRPRPPTSSSNSEESSKESSDDEGINQRKRKRKQIESDSTDEEKHKAKKRLKKTRKIPKGKKGKRKKVAFDSDEENASDMEDSNESESEQEKKSKKKQTTKGKKTRNKKKRGRIRENTDSDEEENVTPVKGRKKIRKQFTDEKLKEETRKARRLEEERRRRLLERTRIAESEETPAESWHVPAVVLEKDDETKESVVEVHSDLVQHLKPHQVKGIQFMYDNVVDSVKAYKKGDKGGGCILAHCMGLGKTLQVVSLIHTLHNSKELDFTKTLVIAPLNTVLNWEVEFDKWLSVDQRMEVFVLKQAGPNNWHRADMLNQWQRYGGVMILGYDMYRNLSLCNRIRSKSQKKIFRESLVDPGPDLVVCDEGHILRNDQSAVSKAVNSIKTLRRIVLTGTPLQNNLIEYHCMVSFVKPNLLGTRKEFMNMFGNPILNGQCVDSIPLDVRIMKQSCHVLYKLLEGCVQRRDYSVLTPFLPPKHEYVIKVRLSETQRKLYSHYLNTFVFMDGSLDRRGASLFSDYQALMRIWTHPWCLKLEAIRRSLRAPYSDSENSLDGFVVHTDEEDDSESIASSDGSSVASNENSNKNPEVFELKSSSDEESDNQNTSDEEVMPQPSQRLTRSKAPVKVDESDEGGEEGDNKTRSGASFKGEEEQEKEWYDEFLAEEDEYNVELSGKMALLLEILADAEAVDEKVLVFTQSLVTLDLIERALGGGEVGGDRENWCKGCDYFRLDGSTSVHLRQRWADIFNDLDNKTARLFLISTKAGGLGINLVAANRVIVFDVSWNPSHDVQSIFRVYRFGQTKPVYVYRLVSEGVMEERIYDRQIAKLSTSQRVIDKHQIERHFTAKDLAELYRFTPSVCDEEKDDKGNAPTLPLPKDAVLADLINRMHPKWIVKYHEHDSLLQNVQEEQLTEEECKQAWAAYEAQKNQEKNNRNMRALQAEYAQQQLQQQQQAIPSQSTAHISSVVLHEMQQLQRQQLSERMARLQAPIHQQQNHQFLTSIQAKTVAEQLQQGRMPSGYIQHLNAVRPVYQPPAAPGGTTYQPMMSYITQQQPQAHHLIPPQPSNPPQPATVVPMLPPGTLSTVRPQFRYL